MRPRGERKQVVAIIEDVYRDLGQAKAEVGRLLDLFMRLEHGGVEGISEDGCVWCLTSPEHPSGVEYTVSMSLAEKHLDNCPIALALCRRDSTSPTPPVKP